MCLVKLPSGNYVPSAFEINNAKQNSACIVNFFKSSFSCSIFSLSHTGLKFCYCLYSGKLLENTSLVQWKKHSFLYCSSISCVCRLYKPGMWKRLFRQPLPLPHLSLPLPTEPGLHLVYELADKHHYQNQQLTIDKGTLLVKMIV